MSDDLEPSSREDSPRVAEAPGVLGVNARLRGRGGVSVSLRVEVGHGAGVHIEAPDFEYYIDGSMALTETLALIDWSEQCLGRDAPERSLAALSLPGLGLTIDVVSGDAAGRRLQFTATEAMDTPTLNPIADLLLDMETSMRGLWHWTRQLAGKASKAPSGVHLVSPTAEGEGPFIWSHVHVPDGSRLNGLAVIDADNLPAPGRFGLLTAWLFDPDVDPELEMEYLRTRSSGVTGGVVGTLPDGQQFGVLMLQSRSTVTFPGEEAPLQVNSGWELAGPGWDALGPSPPQPAAPDQDCFDLATLVEGWVVFAEPAGYSVFTRDDVETHLGRPLPTDAAYLRLLRALPVEATGVAGAEALLTDDQCLYPSTEHVCSGDPVTEVAQAWQEQMALADDDLDF